MEMNEEMNAIDVELQEIEETINILRRRRRELQNRRDELLQIQEAESMLDTNISINWAQSFPWTNTIYTLLHNKFQLNAFRSTQEQVINATLSNRDCFVVMRSGGGKSLCYQLPAIYQKDGFTVVVSPLLSLIQDQVRLFQLIAGPDTAQHLSGVQSRAESSVIHKSMIEVESPLKLLFVTPEKIMKSKLLLARLEKANGMRRLQRFVIDEAHCCSQWGHDFRSDYAKLGLLKRQFPTVPILALTATASPRIALDVQSILELNDIVNFRSPCFRENLRYEVWEKPETDIDAIMAIYSYIKSLPIKSSGIIYCLSRKESEVIAEKLQALHIRAAPYHAYRDDKEHVHNEWIHDRLDVVVATIAFGLGINKPDVRYVIHFTLSKSIDGYYQESGRAGRDGHESKCVLLYRPSDVVRVCSLAHAEMKGMHNLLQMVKYAVSDEECRHEIMARSFGESITSSTKCSDMCDNCSRNIAPVNRINLSDHSRAIIEIIKDTSNLEKRLTLNQLADMVKSKKTLGKYDALDLAPPLELMKKRQVETLVIHLILQNVLQTEISYTAYNTICYIVLGCHSHKVCSGAMTIEIPGDSHKVISDSSLRHKKNIQSKKRKLSNAAEIIEVNDDASEDKDEDIEDFDAHFADF